MTSKILQRFRERLAEGKKSRSGSFDSQELVDWMSEIEARLDYLEVMVESPKERP